MIARISILTGTVLNSAVPASSPATRPSHSRLLLPCVAA
jgi:hypothetical protein